MIAVSVCLWILSGIVGWWLFVRYGDLPVRETAGIFALCLCIVAGPIAICGSGLYIALTYFMDHFEE